MAGIRLKRQKSAGRRTPSPEPSPRERGNSRSLRGRGIEEGVCRVGGAALPVVAHRAGPGGAGRGGDFRGKPGVGARALRFGCGDHGGAAAVGGTVGGHTGGVGHHHVEAAAAKGGAGGGGWSLAGDVGSGVPGAVQEPAGRSRTWWEWRRGRDWAPWWCC